MTKPLVVGELFAGIGGFGLAAERAGCEVAWASEIDDFATRVYGARFPDVRQLGDVTKVDAAEPVDLLTAGFPYRALGNAVAVPCVHWMLARLVAASVGDPCDPNEGTK